MQMQVCVQEMGDTLTDVCVYVWMQMEVHGHQVTRSQGGMCV